MLMLTTSTKWMLVFVEICLETITRNCQLTKTCLQERTDCEGKSAAEKQRGSQKRNPDVTIVERNCKVLNSLADVHGFFVDNVGMMTFTDVFLTTKHMGENIYDESCLKCHQQSCRRYSTWG
eukprot:m.147103 g.147103  ORF g.147103 m.147103 type:complete len:122 (+) comp13239_c2_seq1:1782-2147(+)